MGGVRLRYNCDLSNPEFNRPPKEGHGFIYRYTFKNGKCYIGQTIKSIKTRTHGHRAQRVSVVDRVIASGAFFEIDILSEPKLECLDDAERYCISVFKTMCPNGYNMTDGGNANRCKITDETRKKISERSRDFMLRMMNDPIQKQRFNFKRKGVPVLCLETGKVYGTTLEAAEAIGRRTLSIRLALRGEVNTVGGYHWYIATGYAIKHPEDVLECLKEWEQTKKNMTRGYNRKQYKIRCIETGKKYNSLEEVAYELNTTRAIIHRVVSGKQKSTHGYHFERMEV